MNNQNNKQLQTQIIQLKKQNTQLRLFLHEIIEACYRTINQEENPTEEEKHE